MSAAEKEAEQAQALVRGCGAVLEDYNKHRAALAAQYAELQAKVSQLTAAKQWEESILPQIFGGAPGDEKENALEREVDLVAPRVQQVRQFAVSYGQAYELTSGARKQLNNSVECLQAALQVKVRDHLPS